ncbi:MAG: LacI family DNA-binding transcriptional regulator [Oscillospiraceae bacterium]|nr:LacI family DNA-binding transcriptional regulator [Oscillospiraceae bacterium]
MTFKANLTIDDIARELGVSKTTVSRAISGKGRISAATRERVQAYIELHNYRPSAAAKGLAESRTYNLALVLPKDFINLDIPFVRNTMSAICEEAFHHNYNIMICLCTDDAPDHLVRILDHRKADAVILTRTLENDRLLDFLASRGFPFATLGSLPLCNQDKAIVEADHDQLGGCRAFSLAFLGSGTGKAALLINDMNYIVNQSRLAGFQSACRELGIPLEQTPVCSGINDQESCCQAVEGLLAQGVRRFLCSDEDIAERALRALKANGLRIPQDAVLASLADSDKLQNAVPPISALHFDPLALGSAACREMIRALQDEPYDPKPRIGYEICMRGSF